MWEVLSPHAVQAILAILGLMVVVFVGFQVLTALRPSTSKADTSPPSLGQDFEEMYLEGDVDAEELRRIKTVLGKQETTR